MRRRALFCAIILGCLNWSMLSQPQLRAQDDVRFFESKISTYARPSAITIRKKTCDGLFDR